MLGALKTVGGLAAKFGKGAWLAIGGTVAVAGVDVVSNPKDGYVSNWLSDAYTTIMNSTKEAGVDSGFQGFYKFFEKLAKFIESFTGEGSMTAMTNWARRGMGKEEVAYANGAGGNDNGGATVENNEPGSITYTADNALTLNNFVGEQAWDGALSGENILHKANVFAHGAAEGVTHVVNIVGHAADGADWVSGKALSLFGVDTGYADRNISEYTGSAMRNGLNSVWEVELKTAWDRAAHFTGELAPAAVTGYYLAPSIAGAFGSAATSPTLNVVAGNSLGNAFTTAVAGAGLTSTAGVVLNTTGLAMVPALDNG